MTPEQKAAEYDRIMKLMEESPVDFFLTNLMRMPKGVLDSVIMGLLDRGYCKQLNIK